MILKGALPRLEGVGHYHLHSSHCSRLSYKGEDLTEVGPTHPHEEGHREIKDLARNLVNVCSIKLFNYKRLIQYALNFGCF